MKQIIIFLLLVIVALIGYGQYKEYKRFSLSEYEYKTPQTIDVANANKSLLLDYYEAVEAVNGYVITQWSTEGIDVRNPSDDDEAILAAVSEYRKKLGNVKYYEALLSAPVQKETEQTHAELSEVQKKNNLLKKIFYDNPQANSLRLGERSAVVYEVQRLLNEKGDSIVHDGYFSSQTYHALRAFEAKHNLYSDGKLDAITLEYLLK